MVGHNPLEVVIGVRIPVPQHMKDKTRLKLRQIYSKFKTDSVDFKVTTTRDDYDGIDWSHTDIIINKESIFERLKKYETFEAERTGTNDKLAGNYLGIDPGDLIRFFYSKNGFQIINKNCFKISISQCSKCSSASCTSHLYCDCQITPLTIKFSNFRQEFKPMLFDNSKKSCPENIDKHKWNYEAFGPFIFSKGEFLSNLNKTLNLTATI